MVTQQKLEVNRLIARCSGLLPGEDPALYHQFIQGTLAEFAAQTPLAIALALRLAHLAWHQLRLPAALAGIFAIRAQREKAKTPEQTLALSFTVFGPTLNGFERLQRYQASLDRSFAKALELLLRLQTRRRQFEATAPPQPPAPVQSEATAPQNPAAVQIEPTATPEPPAPAAVQIEPTPPPPPPAQDEPTASPLTLSPCHPVTLSSSPSPKMQSEPTAPPPRQLTPRERRRLRIAARNGALPNPPNNR